MKLMLLVHSPHPEWQQSLLWLSHSDSGLSYISETENLSQGELTKIRKVQSLSLVGVLVEGGEDFTSPELLMLKK